MLAAGGRALGAPLDDGYFVRLEEILLGADVGPAVTARLLAGVRSARPRSLDEAGAALAASATALMSRASRELVLDDPLGCILLYGVNGAGKTTSAGKLAWKLRQGGRRPLLVAADTYRAAATEQLMIWAERAGVPCHSGAAGADPASVVHDGVSLARGRGHDTVIVDTAGRLQTQRNLLDELAKIGRVTSRALQGAPYESWLVLDAIHGLSSLAQARIFDRAVSMTGLVLAKLDGSARGGAVIAIENELDVPIKFAGVGEQLDDLVAFDADQFLRALFM